MLLTGYKAYYSYTSILPSARRRRIRILSQLPWKWEGLGQGASPQVSTKSMENSQASESWWQ